MMTNEHMEEQLTSWLLEELPPEQMAAVDRHVQDCDQCRRLADDLRSTLETVYFAMESSGEADQRLAPERRKAVFSQQWYRRLRVPAGLWPQLSIAAALVLLLGVTIWVLPHVFRGNGRPTHVAEKDVETENDLFAALDADRDEPEAVTYSRNAVRSEEEQRLPEPSAGRVPRAQRPERYPEELATAVERHEVSDYEEPAEPVGLDELAVDGIVVEDAPLDIDEAGLEMAVAEAPALDEREQIELGRRGAQTAQRARMADAVQPPAARVPPAPAEMPPPESPAAGLSMAGRVPVPRELSFTPFLASGAYPVSHVPLYVDVRAYDTALAHMRAGRRPPPELVSVESFYNSFNYDFRPLEDRPVRIDAEVAPHPFREGLHLMFVSVKAKRSAFKAAQLHRDGDVPAINVHFNVGRVRTYRRIGDQPSAEERLRLRGTAAEEQGDTFSLIALYELTLIGHPASTIATVCVHYWRTEAETASICRAVRPEDMSEGPGESSWNLRLAAAVAEWAEQLQQSPFVDADGVAIASDMLEEITRERSDDRRIAEAARLIRLLPELR